MRADDLFDVLYAESFKFCIVLSCRCAIVDVVIDKAKEGFEQKQ